MTSHSRTKSYWPTRRAGRSTLAALLGKSGFQLSLLPLPKRNLPYFGTFTTFPNAHGVYLVVIPHYEGSAESFGAGGSIFSKEDSKRSTRPLSPTAQK